MFKPTETRMTKDSDKPKFTPGPWRTIGRCVFTGDENAYLVADAQTEANANLIAAAPEMYELLERLSHALYAEDGDEWAKEINSLLAKARSEWRNR